MLVRPYLGHYYLIVVDAHSKWIEAQIVNSTSSEVTIKVLRSIFSTHGIPEQIVSDNGSGYTSQEFTTFITENGIKHSLTSPYHPSSNGLAERAVQTVKQGIAKLEGNIHTRLNRFLLTYRITPQTSTGLSPSELLMGRRIRTCLDLIHPDTVQKVANKQQDKLKSNGEPRKFTPGDELYAKNYSGHGKWIPVTVIQTTGPLSYKVRSQTGHVLRRHVDQLCYHYTTENQVLNPESVDLENWPPPSLPSVANVGTSLETRTSIS